MRSKLLRKDYIFLAVSFFYIIYIIFPLFADLTNIPVYLPALLVVFTLSLLYPRAMFSKPLAWLLGYIGIIFLYIICGKSFHINGLESTLSPVYRLIIETAWILPSTMIFSVLVYRKNDRLYKIIGYGSVILLVLSYIYILPLLQASANFLREDMDMENRQIGLPGYDLMHSYALMILPLCLYIKKSVRFYKLLNLVLLLLFGYIVVQTAVTTSLVIIIFTVFLVLLYKPGRIIYNSSIVIIGSMVLLLLYYSGFFLNLVDWLMPCFENTAVYFKLQDIHYSILKGTITGDSLTARMDYHQLSWASFFRNPIVGAGNVGGHSKIIDVLGSMGLAGAIPYLMFIVSVLRKYVQLNKLREYRAYICVSFIMAFVYLYTKGIFGAPGYLFMMVIVPSLIVSLYKIKAR